MKALSGLWLLVSSDAQLMEPLHSAGSAFAPLVVSSASQTLVDLIWFYLGTPAINFWADKRHFRKVLAYASMIPSRILQLLVLHEDLWSIFTLWKVRGWDLRSFFFMVISSFPSPSADEAAFSPTYVSIALSKIRRLLQNGFLSDPVSHPTDPPVCFCDGTILFLLLGLCAVIEGQIMWYLLSPFLGLLWSFRIFCIDVWFSFSLISNDASSAVQSIT